MDPKMHQHRAPEAPKTLLEPGCRWKLVSEPFWGPFWDPPGPRKSCSRCGAVLFFANLASRAREPEIAPQMSPKSSLKRPPEAPECPKMSLQIGARISIKCQLRFLRFWSPKMAPKIAQKTASEPRARPKPAQGPPRGLQRALREAFWAHSGLNLGPPGAHVRAFSGCTFASFGLLLVYCWCSFSLASSPPLLAF